MKREGQEVDVPYAKRARHENMDQQDRRGGRGQFNPHFQHDKQHEPARHHGHSHSHDQDRYSQPRQNGGRARKPYSSQHQHQQNRQDVVDSAIAAIPPLPTVQDPTTTLLALLKSLTTRPEAITPEALENATQLLAHLSSRDKSSTASLDLFQPATVQHPSVHAYAITQPIQPYPVPPLPSIPDGPCSEAVFTHKSTTQHDRVSGAADLTYEKLEFLGDAYIEIISTRLIFARYPTLPAGRQAQTRERIVKNETLAKFGRAYGFRDRLQASDIEQSSKAAVKILADVFEAYVAAVILSDPTDGFRRAEQWLTELWAPILFDDLGPGVEKPHDEYNSNAKADLQKKILGNDTKLEYLEDRPMEQMKHVQKYYIALYLTGYGFDKERIGYGEGRNKVEAGNRAAMQAMTDKASVIEEAARQLAAIKERKRLEKLEREKTEADSLETIGA